MSVLEKIMTGINFPKSREKQSDVINEQSASTNLEVDPILKTLKLAFVEELKKVHEDKELNKFSLAMLTYMKQHQMKTSGARVGLPCPTIESLQKLSKLCDPLLKNFQGKFGFKSPTAIQSIAIPNILQRRNFIGIAPTGSGKTLAYLLPICQLLSEKKNSQALVVAPTFELSVQIYKVCVQLIGKSNPLLGLKISHIQKMEEDISEYNLVVSTPQKFLSLVAEDTTGKLAERFECIILDEADKFFELSFMPQLEQLLELFKTHEKQYVLVSATLPTEIEKAVNTVFVDKTQAVIGGKVNVLNTIDQRLVYCANEEGKLYEIENIINCGQLEVPCVIFVQSKERVRQIYQIMKRMKVYADYLSAELSLQARENKVKAFEERHIWVLITTDLLARGVDFPDLKMVINFDMPTSNVTYIHRVGRTGRAGKKGKALTFFTNEDKLLVRKLADLLKQSNCEVPEWIFTVEKGTKREMQQLVSRPIQREDLGPTKRVKYDKEFHDSIRKKDYEYYKNNPAKGDEVDENAVFDGPVIEYGLDEEEDQNGADNQKDDSD